MDGECERRSEELQVQRLCRPVLEGRHDGESNVHVVRG